MSRPIRAARGGGIGCEVSSSSTAVTTALDPRSPVLRPSPALGWLLSWVARAISVAWVWVGPTVCGRSSYTRTHHGAVSSIMPPLDQMIVYRFVSR